MNCPSCNRNLASTLSICPSCGTMVFDSVREELAQKISPAARITNGELKKKPAVSITPVLPPPADEIPAVAKATMIEPTVETIINEPAPKKPETIPFVAKPTSPTLIDFNNKNATLPDWRLQIQNAVVKRRGARENIEPRIVSPAKPQVAVARSRQTGLATQGATALKVEVEPKPVANSAELSPLEKALIRIEQSRQKFLVEDSRPELAANSQASVKQFPPVLQNRKQEFLHENGQSQTAAKFTAKPNVTSISDLKVEKFDTNKLPPLPARISSSFENRPVTYVDLNSDIEEEGFIKTSVNETSDVIDEEIITEIPHNEEEIDDCAPLSLRFNAAVFDLLIGSFFSLLLLSPFMLLNGNFFSGEGLLAFLATCAIVMFVYMTVSVGFLSRTFGMKLFSLEIVDIDENAYPTVHQAAVSSSVYLVSLALGGLGFLTLLLNNEKRAAHDLLSGTIIVKEY